MHSPALASTWLETFFALSDEAACVLDARGRCVAANRAAGTLLECHPDNAIGAAFDDLAAPVPSDESDGPASRNLDLRLRLRSGRIVSVQSRTVPLADGHEMRILRDVSETKLLETELLQSQKLEAIGRLAGGVAHDFNNLLTVILGYTEALLGQIDGDSSLLGAVSEIRQAADRASLLTQQLLLFSRKQASKPSIQDPKWVLSNLDRLIHRVLGEDIKVRYGVDEEVGTILIDRGQLDQVLLNVVVNARDAMPHGGALSIECDSARVEGAQALALGAAPGEYVVFSVSDTGLGMDPETMQRIFEPFFTTKGARGTGLGLATVYGIVKQSGGWIHVESQRCQGTAFRIAFPRAYGVSEVVKPEVPRVTGGTERVLLVEDERAVRAMVRTFLQTFGYSVIESASPHQAVELAQDPSVHFDLLLTDVVMPGLSGPELVEIVSAARPDTKILYMSGYTEHATLNGERLSGRTFLQKPFTPTALEQKVREALEARV